VSEQNISQEGFGVQSCGQSCGKYYVVHGSVSGSRVVAMAVAINNGVEMERGVGG